jgi:hypothetical protein
MSDVSVAPDLAAEHDGLAARTTARSQRGAGIVRAYGAGSGLVARFVQLVLGGGGGGSAFKTWRGLWWRW